jgi:imidazoleglycerol-phosphate dehydratase
MTTVRRNTRETSIEVTVSRNADQTAIETTRPFLDHMLTALARYSGLGLRISAKGDLPHHLIEDCAITLGAAIAEATPATCARFGNATIPMDDALVQCVIDLGGRPYYGGRLPSRMYDHWMQSFAMNARATVHIRVLRGRDRHHIVEAAFKSLGIALRQAMSESGAVFSTKGAVSLEVTR